MRSYDARKISTESLDVSLQDSNIIANFRDDFRLFIHHCTARHVNGYHFMKPLIWLGCMQWIRIWSWFFFEMGLEGFWIKMWGMLKALRAVCGTGHFFLLLIFWVNFGSLTFFLVWEDLSKIMNFEERIHNSDTWIIIPSHELSDLSSLNSRQIELWMLLLIN